MIKKLIRALKRLFNPFTNFETNLVNQLVPNYLNLNISANQAKEMAEDTVDASKHESKTKGTYKLPNELGNIFLGEGENNNSEIQKLKTSFLKRLPLLEIDGVTQKDIKWWWNLYDVERRVINLNDEGTWMGTFITLLEKGKTEEDAGKEANRIFPIYRDPNENDDLKNLDRPLPFELHKRVNDYIDLHSSNDPEKFKKEFDSFSSFNAFVRNKIKSGKI